MESTENNEWRQIDWILGTTTYQVGLVLLDGGSARSGRIVIAV